MDSALSPSKIIVCLHFGNAARLLELAEACYRFTPKLAVRATPGDQALFLDVQLHPQDEPSRERAIGILLLKLQALARRFELNPRTAAADDAPSAFVLAKTGARIRQAEPLPIECLSDYATPFAPDEDLQKKLQRMAATFRTLGILTLGAFSDLPPASIVARFGKDGLHVSQQIRQALHKPWPSFQLPERVSEQAQLCDAETMSPCYDLDSLLFVLKTVIDRAMARLRGRFERASKLEIRFELDDDRDRSWTLELPMPQGSATGLLPILRDRFSYDLGREPLSSAVTYVGFTVLETVPGHAAQRHFFQTREDQQEEWDALLGRLVQKLGKDRAFVASPVDRHLPERAWERKSAPAPSPGARAAPVPPRPARLLPSPEPLQRMGEHLILSRVGRPTARNLAPAGPDRARAQRWKIVEWNGPERLSGEWWSDPARFPGGGFHRDYYRAVTESGEHLWVFHTPQGSQLYLHGYFD